MESTFWRSDLCFEETWSGGHSKITNHHHDNDSDGDDNDDHDGGNADLQDVMDCIGKWLANTVAR